MCIRDSIRTASDVAPETLVNLAIFYGPAVLALGFISVLFYFGYKLTPEMHRNMLKELAERRNSAEAS